MTGTSQRPNPLARTSDIVVTDAGSDTLVYDLRTHRAHSLDDYSTRVWRLCDGSRDVRAIAAALADSPALDPALAESVVEFTLDRLEAVALLETRPAAGDRLSRRELLRRGAAVGLTLAVPAVLSVAAPSTLLSQASGCKGAVCLTDAQCCALNTKCTGNTNDQRPGQCV
jgi:hypothetical protein